LEHWFISTSPFSTAKSSGHEKSSICPIFRQSCSLGATLLHKLGCMRSSLLATCSFASQCASHVLDHPTSATTTLPSPMTLTTLVMQGTKRAESSKKPTVRLPVIAPKDDHSSSTSSSSLILGTTNVTVPPRARLPPRSRTGCWCVS
jgi:hypothetical protein